jgi:predicted AAA+ superfamily ATPase
MESVNFIKRELFQTIQRFLPGKEILFIVGPRQCGKTTLLKLLERTIQQRGEKTVFFNLDFQEDSTYFTSQQRLLDKLQLEFGHERGYVFIDEVQRIQNAGRFLKGIYDLDIPHKIIASGSGSVELKENLHESLAGRKIVFPMRPVSFREYVQYRTQYKYEDSLGLFFTVDRPRAVRLLQEYMQYGGYPKCILAETAELKRLQLNEIYSSFVERDIGYWLQIDKVYAFRELLRHLAITMGKLLNYSELATKVHVSLPTIKNYLYYAEKIFIIELLRPFFSNPLKELSKAPIVYFLDPGLRNFIAGVKEDIIEHPDAPFVFQQLVYQALKEWVDNTSYEIKYYRSKDRAEVDFILDKGSEQLPFEVKFTSLKSPEFPSSLRSFILKYKPKTAFVVNLDLDSEVTFQETHVRFITYFTLVDNQTKDSFV